MRKIFLIALSILFSIPSFSQKERKLIRDGNKLYDSKKYSDSEIAYRKALDKKPNSYESSFNLGDALYKQKKYDEATKMFGTIADNKKDPKERAKVYHNLGNSLLNDKKVKESIESYENALKLNPYDNDTRYNLAYAKQLMQQQQQQNKNKDQNKDNKNQEKKDQQKPKENKQDKNQQQQQQQNKISKEDAQRMLESVQNDEKDVVKRLKEEKAKANHSTLEKNW